MLWHALLLIVVASFEVGLMSEVRKIYQTRNGTGFFSTGFFMMLSMTLIAPIAYFFSNNIELSGIIIFLAFLYALVFTVTSILCLVGSAWGNLSIIILCASLGTLVMPSLYGLIVFPEENVITLFKVLGFLFALCTFALSFLNKENVSTKNKNSLKYKLTCITVFFTQGSALIIFSKVKRQGIDNFEFLTLYTALVALMMAVILVANFIMDSKAREENKHVISAKSIWLIIGYAFLAFTSEFILLYCAGKVPITFQSPVSFSVPVVTVAILDFIIYREKLNKVQLIQVFSAVVSCMFFVAG